MRRLLPLLLAFALGACAYERPSPVGTNCIRIPGTATSPVCS